MGDQDQNMAVVRRFYEGYAAGDLEKIKETLAEDVTWLIPGHHPLAGLKRGAEEIVAFFDQLGKANFQPEVLSLSASEDSVVDVHRGWGEHGDAKLDIDWVLYYLWEVWGESLKPLPDRLSDA